MQLTSPLGPFATVAAAAAATDAASKSTSLSLAAAASALARSGLPPAAATASAGADVLVDAAAVAALPHACGSVVRTLHSVYGLMHGECFSFRCVPVTRLGSPRVHPRLRGLTTTCYAARQAWAWRCRCRRRRASSLTIPQRHPPQLATQRLSPLRMMQQLMQPIPS
jgi:hypothetical protein